MGRRFTSERRVRLADVDPTGRLRLDACARYVQDVASDDSADAGLRDDSASWVVRRTELTVRGWPSFGHRVELATWCGGVGSRWAQRCVSVVGDDGADIESASLWVHVDLATMLPKRLPAAFVETYGVDTPVGSKLTLPKPSPGLPRSPWPLRRTDFDVLGHVNNAAYWAVLEEDEVAAPPFTAVVEFVRPVDPATAVEVVVDPDGRHRWLVAAGTDVVHMAAVVRADPT